MSSYNQATRFFCKNLVREKSLKIAADSGCDQPIYKITIPSCHGALHELCFKTTQVGL